VTEIFWKQLEVASSEKYQTAPIKEGIFFFFNPKIKKHQYKEAFPFGKAKHLERGRDSQNGINGSSINLVKEGHLSTCWFENARVFDSPKDLLQHLGEERTLK
jgi:hypothetical protein